MRRGNFLFGKAGLSGHIEMVLSFVLFIGFVFFVLIFVRPYGNDFLTGSVVSGAQYNFFESAKVDLVTFFVSVDEISGATCINVNLPSELIDVPTNSSIVRFVDGTDVDSDLEGSVLSSFGSGGNSYYVFLSSEFDDDVLSGCVDAVDNVNFGSFHEEKIISVKKLEEMKIMYDDNYDSLRQSLAIPDIFDFAVVSPVVSMQREIPFSSEVFAQDYVEKVLLEDGEIKFVRFTVKLW